MFLIDFEISFKRPKLDGNGNIQFSNDKILFNVGGGKKVRKSEFSSVEKLKEALKEKFGIGEEIVLWDEDGDEIDISMLKKLYCCKKF